MSQPSATDRLLRTVEKRKKNSTPTKKTKKKHIRQEKGPDLGLGQDGHRRLCQGAILGSARKRKQRTERESGALCPSSTPPFAHRNKKPNSKYSKQQSRSLSQGLVALGYDLVSTGGSAAALSAAGLPVSTVESLTGFPEMLSGRVKTLHPGVHGGILAVRSDPAHMRAISAAGIPAIDVVAVNLYPFRATVTSAGKPPTFDEAIENIDIGGPAMIRAAAKNHASVTVVVDPSDYPGVLSRLSSSSEASSSSTEASSSSSGPSSPGGAFRAELAWKAFSHTGSYDAQVAEWMWGAVGGKARGSSYEPPPSSSSPSSELARVVPPPEIVVPMRLASTLRYGENPHQSAAFYEDLSLAEAFPLGGGGVARSVQRHGKEMSYNNYLDADAAYQCVTDFAEPACVIVKHTNPCGVALASNSDASDGDLRPAYRAAVKADPTSAFGGIVAFNRFVDEELAAEIREFRSPADGETRMFYEIVVAPGYTPAGLEKLKGKSKTLRILETPPRARGKASRSLRQVGGGWLLQDSDAILAEDVEFNVVSEAKPTERQLEDLRFAWTVAKHVKSNAIAAAKNGELLGMGSGQPNRVKSTQIALEKAGPEAVKGSALASDAFFPFSWGDSVEAACAAGVGAIAHPGGSMRDQDAIDCCNKYGVVLCTTGVRHFKH